MNVGSTVKQWAINTYKSDRGLIVSLVFLLIIVGFGYELRYESVNQSVVPAPIRADATSYYTYAYNLRHLGVYSQTNDSWTKGATEVPADAHRTPGYPLFIAPFVDGKPTAEIVNSILFAQVIVSTITIIFAYCLFRGGFSRSVSLLGALLVSISPHLVTANIYVLTETLFCFFLVVFFWGVKKYFEAKRYRYLFVLGALLAGAALVRPSAQYFIVPLLGFLLVLNWKGDWKRVLGFAFLGFALVMSPWMIRNAMIDNGSSSLGRASISHGMYPGLMYKDDPKSKGVPYRADPNHREVAKNTEVLTAELVRRFTEETGRHIQWFLFGKPIMLWSWDIIGGMGDVWVYPVAKTPYSSLTHFKASRELMKLCHDALMILGLIGALLVWFPFMARRCSYQAIMLLRCISLFLMYYTFLHMVAAPYPRYSIPARPLMYAMSLVPIVFVYEYIKGWVARGDNSAIETRSEDS